MMGPVNNTHTPSPRRPLMSKFSPAKPGTSRWLSANGHPGYGPQFAAKVQAFIAAQFDADDVATASPQRYSGMVWAGVRAAR